MMARSRRRHILGALGAVATATLVFAAMKATEGAVEYGVQPTLFEGVSTVLYLAALPQGQPPQAAEVGLGQALLKHKRLSVDNSTALGRFPVSKHRGDIGRLQDGDSAQHRHRRSLYLRDGSFAGLWDVIDRDNRDSLL